MDSTRFNDEDLGGLSIDLGHASMNVVTSTNWAKPTLKEVIAEHGRFVRALLSRLGVRPHDLDDVAIEVFLGVHFGLADFDPSMAKEPPRAIRAWLFGICGRQTASYHRKVFRRLESSRDTEELDRIESDSPHPEMKLLTKEDQALLIELLTQTTPERRDVLLAYDIEGNTMRDVASALGIPVNTAWNRRRLGLDDLRAAWRRKQAAEP